MISSVHLRALVVAINIAAATLVLASPVPPFEVAKTKRAVNCPATDSAGSALTGSSADPSDEFATCAYQTAGECTYFFANGSFSSGSSACPAGLQQQDAATTAATGTVSSNVNCPATDKEGTALTASSDDSADEFATCTYQGGAGECTYFFASGDFSSGSSNCPAGLPQTAATTFTTATEATTSSILSVPQATTSSAAATTSSTAESSSTSTSTVFSTLTSSSVLSTLTSSSVSASTPDSAVSTSTDAPTTPDAQTPAPAAQTTVPDASEPSTTDVTVTETFAPTDTPSPVGAAAADSNAALSMRGCTTAAAVAGAVVPFGVVLGMILM